MEKSDINELIDFHIFYIKFDLNRIKDNEYALNIEFFFFIYSCNLRNKSSFVDNYRSL